jgi:hypothetical protein
VILDYLLGSMSYRKAFHEEWKWFWGDDVVVVLWLVGDK